MLSRGFALMARPKLMLLDEPSLGLSPAIVQSIFQQIQQFAREDGRSVRIVEQNVRAALRIADRAYFMRSGDIILEEASATALARGNWWDLF
jgi:branched-chain amino acid transport system ATP-binding protein